ncbi:MAG: SH3 domain-containing protein [Clostridia bacterium]|nr:SH3 domain-containing protein [Clostridia bacterium]
MIKSSKTLLAVSVSIICIFAMTFMVYGEEKTQGVIIGSDVNIRKTASIKSEVVNQTSLGETVEILSHERNWYLINTSSGAKGWILNDLVAANEEKDPIKKGIITTDKLNIRKEPTTNSNILNTFPKGREVTIIGIQESWYQIAIGESEKGWIYSQYVKIKPNYSRGNITGTNVNLRKENSIHSGILDKLNPEFDIHIKNYSNGWYNILTHKGQEGWVNKDFLRVSLGNNIENTVSRSTNRRALKIVQEAKKLLGIPYRYGGNGPSSFDCSGFTSYVFKRYGIKLPRTSRSQAKVGIKVSRSKLQIGDMVFFDTSGAYNGVITHVGIYIGNGQFIHSSSGKRAKKVVISPLNTGYYNGKFVTARRVY